MKKPINRSKGGKLWAKLTTKKKKRRPSKRAGGEGGDEKPEKEMSMMDKLLAKARAKKAAKS